MQLVQSMMTKNPCYTGGRKLAAVKGLMLHSVGCPQPNASVFLKNWNLPSYNNACVHGFIDANTGIVYQTLPWNHRGWHAGKGTKGSANNTHIGVEMCEPSCIKYTGGSSFTCSDMTKAQTQVRLMYQSAVELYAMLCQQFHLDPMAPGVVISHKEGYKLGIASNHGDPEHLWSQLKLGYTMDTFRADVKRTMGGTIPVSSPAASVAAATGTPAPKIVNRRVRVTCDVLNIRSGPGVGNPITGAIRDRGVYTITEEANGWGKLLSGAGWISMQYTKPV